MLLKTQNIQVSSVSDWVKMTTSQKYVHVQYYGRCCESTNWTLWPYLPSIAFY